MKIGGRLTWFLDFARWFSALMVVVYHVRGAVAVHWQDIPKKSALTASVYFATTLGHEAVMIFFVLSGFLVGGSVIEQMRTGSFRFASYATNRISRLYSVLPVALAVGALVDHAGIQLFHYPRIEATPGRPAHNIGDHLGWGIGLGNLLNLQTIIVPPLGTNGVLWSLANEFWYYLMFPLTVMAVWRGTPPRARLGLGLASLAALWFVTPAIRLYFLVWLLGVGVWFMRRPLVKSATIDVFLLIGALAFAFVVPRYQRLAGLLPSGDAHLFFGDLFVGVAFANLLLTVKGMPEAARPMPFRTLNRSLADFSYSLYLFHAPFLYFVVAWYKTMVPETWARPPGVRGAVVALGFLVAIYAYCYAWSLVTERRAPLLRAWLAAGRASFERQRA